MNQSDPTANDYALAWLRIALGLLFLIFAQYKLAGTDFIYGGGFEGWIHQFLQSGTYPFMAPFLSGFVLSHAKAIAWLVAYGELGIGLSLVLGLLVRPASFFGSVYMFLLLLASNYPGPHAAFWQYFGAAMNHLVPVLCFATLGMSNSARVWSVQTYLLRKYGPKPGENGGDIELSSAFRNVFGK